MTNEEINEMNTADRSINGKDEFLESIVNKGYEPKSYVDYINLSTDPFNKMAFEEYKNKTNKLINYEEERKDSIKTEMKSTLDNMLAILENIEAKYPNKETIPKDDADRINIIRRRVQTIEYRLGYSASEVNYAKIGANEERINEEIKKIELDPSLTPMERLNKITPLIAAKRRNNAYYDRANVTNETPSMLEDETSYKKSISEYREIQKAFNGLTIMTETSKYDGYNKKMVDMMDEVQEYHQLKTEEINIKKSETVVKEKNEPVEEKKEEVKPTEITFETEEPLKEETKVEEEIKSEEEIQPSESIDDENKLDSQGNYYDLSHEETVVPEPTIPAPKSTDRITKIEDGFDKKFFFRSGMVLCAISLIPNASVKIFAAAAWGLAQVIRNHQLLSINLPSKFKTWTQKFNIAKRISNKLKAKKEVAISPEEQNELDNIDRTINGGLNPDELSDIPVNIDKPEQIDDLVNEPEVNEQLITEVPKVDVPEQTFVNPPIDVVPTKEEKDNTNSIEKMSNVSKPSTIDAIFDLHKSNGTIDLISAQKDLEAAGLLDMSKPENVRAYNVALMEAGYNSRHQASNDEYKGLGGI